MERGIRFLWDVGDFKTVRGKGAEGQLKKLLKVLKLSLEKDERNR